MLHACVPCALCSNHTSEGNLPFCHAVALLFPCLCTQPGPRGHRIRNTHGGNSNMAGDRRKRHQQQYQQRQRHRRGDWRRRNARNPLDPSQSGPTECLEPKLSPLSCAPQGPKISEGRSRAMAAPRLGSTGYRVLTPTYPPTHDTPAAHTAHTTAYGSRWSVAGRPAHRHTSACGGLNFW